MSKEDEIYRSPVDGLVGRRIGVQREVKMYVVLKSGACLLVVHVCRTVDRVVGNPRPFLSGTSVPWMSLPGTTGGPWCPRWQHDRAPNHFVVVWIWSCRYMHPCSTTKRCSACPSCSSQAELFQMKLFCFECCLELLHCLLLALAMSGPPTSHTVKIKFLYPSVSTLKSIVGMVVTTSPSFSC